MFFAYVGESRNIKTLSIINQKRKLHICIEPTPMAQIIHLQKGVYRCGQQGTTASE